MRAYISFAGFYNSWISPDSALESTREMDADYLAREYGFTDEEITAYFDACNDAFSFSEYKETVGEKWVEEYQALLNDIDGLESVKLDFAAVDSPREYNFTTDACAVRIRADDLRKVRKYAETIARSENGDAIEISEGEEIPAGYYTFTDYIRERLRGRDGFIPHYSNDVHQWGAVSNWDEAQTECLFDFVLPYGEVTDCAGCINEDLIYKCEEAARANDPAPEHWLEAYRAEQAEENAA